jgi:beta-galactosidase
MKNGFLIILACWLFVVGMPKNPLFAQENKKSSSSNPHSFFPKEDLMKFGVFYYPEQWPRDQWKRDLENIAKLGPPTSSVSLVPPFCIHTEV